MIGNITSGNNFGGIAAYLYGPGRHNEHTNARSIASGNTLILDPEKYGHWVGDMNYCASLNRKVKNTVWHCSISAAPEDRMLTDEEWAAIAAQHIEQMGLDEHAWVAVRHGDNHVHVVASRVGYDGTCWSDSYERYRNDDSMRAIEKRHKLTVVDSSRERREPGLAKAPIAEREKAKRERMPMTPRAMLRDEIRGSIRAARGCGPAAFEQELAKRGIKFRANLGRGGRLRGYSVTLGPHYGDGNAEPIWYSTRQLDKELVWHKIAPELELAAITARRYVPVSVIAPKTPR